MLDENKVFNDCSKLCLLTFFVLGNYFALFGLRHSKKSFDAFIRGDKSLASREAELARKWALWGLIPSTIINAAIICAFFLFLFNVLLPYMQNLTAKML